MAVLLSVKNLWRVEDRERRDKEERLDCSVKSNWRAGRKRWNWEGVLGAAWVREIGGVVMVELIASVSCAGLESLTS
jgi:hypothetical protein